MAWKATDFWRFPVSPRGLSPRLMRPGLLLLGSTA